MPATLPPAACILSLPRLGSRYAWPRSCSRAPSDGAEGGGGRGEEGIKARREIGAAPSARERAPCGARGAGGERAAAESPEARPLPPP